jgi:hypothetical protein
VRLLSARPCDHARSSLPACLLGQVANHILGNYWKELVNGQTFLVVYNPSYRRWITPAYFAIHAKQVNSILTSVSEWSYGLFEGGVQSMSVQRALLIIVGLLALGLW